MGTLLFSLQRQDWGAFYMREIKFRAWNGEGILTVKAIDWEHGYILHEDLSIPGPSYESMAPPEPKLTSDLSEAILLQFTGLLDKNGKEIYEGDILIAHLNEKGNIVKRSYGKLPNNFIKPYVVEFKYGAFTCYGGSYNTNFTMKTNETIIGNIYENAELLNEK